MIKIFWTTGTGRVLENNCEPDGWMNDMKVGEELFRVRGSLFLPNPHVQLPQFTLFKDLSSTSLSIVHQGLSIGY